MTGFLFVTVLPAWVVSSDIEHWRKYGKREGRALAHLNAEAQARVRVQAAEPPADEGPRS